VVPWSGATNATGSEKVYGPVPPKSLLRKGNDSEEANMGDEDAVDYERLLHSDEDPKTTNN